MRFPRRIPLTFSCWHWMLPPFDWDVDRSVKPWITLLYQRSLLSREIPVLVKYSELPAIVCIFQPQVQMRPRGTLRAVLSHGSSVGVLQRVTALLRQLLQSRAGLAAENLALRHQIVLLPDCPCSSCSAAARGDAAW